MAQPWWRGRLCAFDTETTGADPQEARLVTAAVALVGGGQPTEPHGWVCLPEVEIPAEAAAIHGYTTERARAEGRPAAEVLVELTALLRAAWDSGAALVAFNASYDLTVLQRELERHALPPIEIGAVVDPRILDRQVDRFRRGKRKLTDCCVHYDVRHDGAHDAAADAIAAARLAWRIGQRFPAVGDLDLASLHQQQIGWYAADAERLERYFAQQGTPRSCPRDWPVQGGGRAAPGPRSAPERSQAT
jgi:DNA polymerase-3 subunit epsilon